MYIGYIIDNDDQTINTKLISIRVRSNLKIVQNMPNCVYFERSGNRLIFMFIYST